MPKYLRIITLLLGLLLLSSCAQNAAPVAADGQLTIVASGYVAYDFARQVAGEHAVVTLLLPSGTDSHDFDPSMQDILTVKNADVFLYTNTLSEPWVPRLLESLGQDVSTIELTHGIELTAQTPDGAITDAHVWLDLSKAIQMLDLLQGKLSQLDPSHADDYAANALTYTSQLRILDTEITAAFLNAAFDTLVFGGHYAAAHFAAHYQLHALTVYESCEEDADPSALAILEVINAIKSNGYPVVFGEENDANTVAQTIADETGAQLLIFNAAHNISRAELNSGLSFLDIMRQNFEQCKVGLGL